MLLLVLFSLISVSTCQYMAEVMRTMNKLGDDLAEKCADLSLLEDKVQSINNIKQQVDGMMNERTETSIDSQLVQLQSGLNRVTTTVIPNMQQDIEYINTVNIPTLNNELEKQIIDAETVVRKVEKQLDAMTAEIRGKAREQDELTEELNLLEEKIQEMKTPDVPKTNLRPTPTPSRNNDAEGVWIITGYQQKKTLNQYIFSQEFYFNNGPYAYRLRMVARLGGDSSITDGFLSLFLQVMPGADDDRLSWPIKGYLTVKLLPQDGVSIPIMLDTVTFSDQEAYRKPGTDGSYVEGFFPNNRPWGYPKGFRHQDIETPAYLRDDTILISYKISMNRF